MKPINAEQLLEQLNWRYATKQFDSVEKISADVWPKIEEALRLTPSSCGLQLWKFVVVADPDVRKKLCEASWGQSQITDASHLVVLVSKIDVSEADLDAHFGNIVKTQGVPVESLAQLRSMIQGFIFQAMDETARHAWTRNQVYIALGNLLTSAAMLGIDACPMEGIDRTQYDEILGLKAQGYSTAVVATLGYRSPLDKYANAPKVRFPNEQLFIHI